MAHILFMIRVSRGLPGVMSSLLKWETPDGKADEKAGKRSVMTKRKWNRFPSVSGNFLFPFLRLLSSKNRRRKKKECEKEQEKKR